MRGTTPPSPIRLADGTLPDHPSFDFATSRCEIAACVAVSAVHLCLRLSGEAIEAPVRRAARVAVDEAVLQMRQVGALAVVEGQDRGRGHGAGGGLLLLGRGLVHGELGVAGYWGQTTIFGKPMLRTGKAYATEHRAAWSPHQVFTDPEGDSRVTIRSRSIRRAGILFVTTSKTIS